MRFALSSRALATIGVASTCLAGMAGTASGIPGPAASSAVTRSVSHGSSALRGKVVLLDPGHNLGAWSSKNRAAINRKVNIGTGWKACQGRGTETPGGYKESAFTMSVAMYTKARLEARGATVFLTRPSNDPKNYGPCIDVRGRMGAKVRANALVSIHGDNEPSRLRGFFVMRPGYVRGWTDDIYQSSGVLATSMNAGLRGKEVPVATWYGPGGYRTRTDLGTLNNSNVPAVMIELGNMKNRSDAAWMTSATHRNNVYAAGLVDGLTRYLLRR
jgi:N-acetylmuramoyl-L-alanine amidase